MNILWFIWKQVRDTTQLATNKAVQERGTEKLFLKKYEISFHNRVWIKKGKEESQESKIGRLYTYFQLTVSQL